MFKERQDGAPISIGAHTLVSTNLVVLGGAVLPNHCLLSAESPLNKALSKEWMPHGGVLAEALQPLPRTAKYFTRPEGFVY